MTRKLAVFDIDGTLTDTNAVDDECYVGAIGEVLRIDPARLDWSGAPHVTDSGMLHWLAERNGVAHVAPEQEQLVIERFLDLLHAALASTPERFRPIAGAHTICERLMSHGWHVAFATGGWERSARLKLAAIGIDPAAFAFASSSDATTREEIVRLAISRAEGNAGSFDRIVSLGDAVWDVRTAAVLRLPFVGVASGERAARLRSAGATAILPHLTDLPGVFAGLDTATIPDTDLGVRPTT